MSHVHPRGVYLGIEGTNHLLEDGLLFLDSQVRFADITDGLSNTLAVGERPPEVRWGFGRWYGGYGRWGTANNILGVEEAGVLGWLPGCHNGPYEFGPGTLADPCSAFHYWSFHPNGGNFLFADGSVRFLTYGARTVLPTLATRAGGETVTLD